MNKTPLLDSNNDRGLELMERENKNNTETMPGKDCEHTTIV